MQCKNAEAKDKLRDNFEICAALMRSATKAEMSSSWDLNIRMDNEIETVLFSYISAKCIGTYILLSFP